MQNRNKSKNLLVGKEPDEVLIFGKEKMFVDQFLWFEEQVGVVTAYQVKDEDVKGHFGILRGVDMIEIIGQSGTAASTALVCKKEQATRDELLERFRFALLGMDYVRFHRYAKTGDQLVCISHITSFRFRQMTIDGKLYRVKNGLDYTAFFEKYKTEDFQNEVLPDDFEVLAIGKNLIGRALKLSKLQ